MIVVYTGETPPEEFTSSIFLAGPSPRKDGDPNWRTEAIAYLEETAYEGVVFAPTYRDKPTEAFDYDKQVGWERKWLNASDYIVFWIPRDLEKLPGFTTNVEFGLWLRSGKILLGSPPGAPKMDYLNWWAEVEFIPRFETLPALLDATLEKLGVWAVRDDSLDLRTGGEREVPRSLWERAEFQSWYKSQKAVGNRLDGAEVVWNFRVGKRKERTFLWALHVNMWVESEQRSKTNEVVIFRPDVSTIVAFCRPPKDSGKDQFLDTEIALVREYRSPANNHLAMVVEVPGGSSVKLGMDADVVASMELEEETGLSIEQSRFRYVNKRQIASTLCAHRAHVYSVELTTTEMLTLKWDGGEPHGNEADSERTYVEIQTVRQILWRSESVDFSNVGMICEALFPEPSPFPISDFE